MASPVAHSLAGTILYFTLRRGNDHEWPGKERRDLLWIILAANLADFDLVPSVLMGDHSLFHRTFSHSFLAVVVFGLIVYAACRWRNHSSPTRMSFVMAGAYLSQLLLDWLSLDPGPPTGIPVFWPFSYEHFAADPAIFLNIERENLTSLVTVIHNTRAVLLETLLIGPLALLAWWWHRRR